MVENSLNRVRLGHVGEEAKLIAVLDDRRLSGEHELEFSGDVGDASARVALNICDGRAEPRGVEVDVEQGRAGGRIDVLDVRAEGDEPVHDLIGRPRDGRHDVDPELVIDPGTRGIIDAGDDVIDAERLAYDSRRDDVRVIARGDSREPGGLLDASLAQRVPIEAHAGDLLTGKVIWQSVKRAGVLINHRYRVASIFKIYCEIRAEATATHNDEMHATNATAIQNKA